jgi:hypothetical protein
MSLHSFLVTYTARLTGVPHSFKSVLKMPQRHKDDYPTNGDARQWIIANQKEIEHVQIVDVVEDFDKTLK